jgi:hypothetical protein
MSTELDCIIHQDTNISQIHNILKQYVIIHAPPYSLISILYPYIHNSGRKIKIIIYHSSRNISIVEPNIRHHILQTAVSAFQNHRLSTPVNLLNTLVHRASTQYSNRSSASSSASSPGVDSGQQCSICLETIMSNDIQCLPCTHIFHRHCISRWLEQSTSCPECRLELA